MKSYIHFIAVLFFILLVSFKPFEKNHSTPLIPDVDIDGKALFNANGCSACHNLTLKTVGPSVAEIAKVYADKGDVLLKFLDGKKKAIIDPPQYPIMKPQLKVVKAMSLKEKEALIKYMLSIKK